MDGVLTEFKEIKGNKIQRRFTESLEQGVNSLLKIDKNLEPKRVREILHGIMEYHQDAKGIVYVYLTQKDKMYRWEIDSLK